MLAIAPLLLTAWVHGDGIGYAAMLRSAVIDHDLDLRDEFAYLSTHITTDARGWPARLMRRGGARPGIDPIYQTPAPDPVTGRTPAYYSVGPALAWAPAYVLARAFAPRPRDAAAQGYGGGYWVAIALTSLACGVAGALLSLQLARSVSTEASAGWAVAAIVGATPLVYYLYLAPDYGHALTVLTASAFYLTWWRTRHADRPLTWLVWGALAGAMFLARWNDLVLALPVFVSEALGLLRRHRGASAWWRLAACKLAAAAGLLLVATPQLAAWQYFHGRPWPRYPEAYVGLPVHGLLATLLSSRHGLFVWTPVTLLGVIGLVLLLRRERELAIVALVSLALLVVSNCTARDWWGGASFGMRRLVSGTPLFALGLAVLLDRAATAVARPGAAPARWLAPVVFATFTTWNLLLLGQYALGMISHTEPVPIATMLTNQPRVIGRVFALLHGAPR
jgi:hypothetical protein